MKERSTGFARKIACVAFLTWDQLAEGWRPEHSDGRAQLACAGGRSSGNRRSTPDEGRHSCCLRRNSRGPEANRCDSTRRATLPGRSSITASVHRLQAFERRRWHWSLRTTAAASGIACSSPSSIRCGSGSMRSGWRHAGRAGVEGAAARVVLKPKRRNNLDFIGWQQACSRTTVRLPRAARQAFAWSGAGLRFRRFSSYLKIEFEQDRLNQYPMDGRACFSKNPCYAADGRRPCAA